MLTGKVFASCPPATGITPFMALIEEVMSHEPYKSAPRVFVIADNGSATAARKPPGGSVMPARTRS